MISVVGGGPSGSYLAYLLASEGEKVNVYEEHQVIGSPIQCTGLLTDSILDLVPIKKEFLVNTLKKARLFSPNGNFTEIKLRNNFVVDRYKFDGYLANMAVDKGANYFLGHKFLDCKVSGKISARFQTKKGVKELQTDYLVGADGPRSAVGRSVGLVTEKRKYIVALQARMDLKNLNCEKDTFESFMERRGFGWVVPENDEVARVGIATVEKNANAYFQDFLKQRCPNKKIIEYQSGTVPIYTLGMKCQKDNIFLVGDAACQVKLSSLDYDESILIKKDNLIRTVRIGELIDKEIEKNKKAVIHEGEIDILKSDEVYSYSPDKKSKNFDFYKTDNLVRHSSAKGIYEIVLDRGYRIKVTGEHSVMSLGHNSLIDKKVQDLKVGKDYLLVNTKLPEVNISGNINLIEWILKESPGLVNKIIVLGGRNLLYGKSTDVDLKNKRTYWYNDKIPLHLFLSRGIIPKNVKLIYKKKYGREIKINNLIELSGEFFRLLGYYVAEGHCNRCVCFSFGKHDIKKGIIDDAIYCIKKVFGIYPQKLHKKLNPSTGSISSYSLNFGGIIAEHLFKKILKSGTGASIKEIPYLVFNVKNELKLEFLKAYLLGDGHCRVRMPKNRRNWSSDVVATTVSRKLASDLILLSFQLGLTPTIRHQGSRQHELYGQVIKSEYAYLVSYSNKKDLYILSDIFKNKKQSLFGYLSKVKEKSGIGLPRKIILDIVKRYKSKFESEFKNNYNYKTFTYPRLEKVFSNIHDEDERIIFIKNLIENRVLVLSIKKLTKVKPTSKYVYDLEVNKTNMFIGGLGPIIVHNTHGGIVLGMLGAEEVKNSIIKHESYDRRWRKRIGRDLYLSWLMWKVLKRFSNEDYNNLINDFKNKELADLLGKYNRDFPSQFIFKVLLKKPSLLKYAQKLLYL